MAPRPVSRRSNRKRIIIVQGGQYGSEAKGAIAGYLCVRDAVDIAVRTGATNAGHTVYAPNRAAESQSFPFKMQQLPVGFVRPECKLVLGAGALIDPEILDREVEMLEDAGYSIRDRLLIDRRAGLHVAAHAARSKASGRHHSMGATGKGCSEALIDRIRNRGQQDAMLFGDSPYARDYDVCDTEKWLNDSYDEGAKILLEGTQGQLLDLYLGPYPYTTHKQTGPAQWMLEAGLSPALPTHIVLVVRTFPIRVAGNSGPLPRETSWPFLARYMNEIRNRAGLASLVREQSICEFEACLRAASLQYKVPPGSDGTNQHDWTSGQRLEFKEAASELNRAAWQVLSKDSRDDLGRVFEMTTVTKKLRRIAWLDRTDLEASARQARPHEIALTFMNYLAPEKWFMRQDGRAVLRPTEMEFINSVSEYTGAPVGLISYGPEDCHILDLR